MILIITHKTDFTADFVINKLNQRKIKYKRFNCDDFLEYKYSLRFNPHFHYSLLGEEEYSAVWFRRTKLPVISDINQADGNYISREIEALFENLYGTINAKWLSPPFNVYKAENKAYQLQIAQKIGFNIPHTLISNSSTEIIDFYIRNNKNIVIKPISRTRIQYSNSASLLFTKIVDEEMMKNIDKYDLTPSIFQENIKKDYELRITVVGNKVFPAAVFSQEDELTKYDWRKKKLPFKSVTIPKAIEEKCIELLKVLNISFGAIDMIKTPEGKYIFLEINPNGQWVWIENQTGLNISGEIIDFLTIK